jgi:hypothetical protein
MHSVLPLKMGVTKWYQSRVDCRIVILDRNGQIKDFIIIEAFLSYAYFISIKLILLLLPHP